MQRLVALAVLAAGLLASGTAYAAEQTVKLAVANMSCFSPLILRKSLSAVPGVTKVAVSFEQESAVVTFDDQKTNVQALIAAATNADYPSKLPAASTAKTQ